MSDAKTPYRQPPSLLLTADSLFSKWGFGDGDMPDAVWEYADETGYEWHSDWHDVLRRLVQKHLLPALDRRVETFDISTIHNPIRAEKVDGVEVIWHGGSGMAPPFAHDCVEVTWEQIVAADNPPS
jgi:hypothetical protein